MSKSSRLAHNPVLIEARVLEGLENLAWQEVQAVARQQHATLRAVAPIPAEGGVLLFHYDGSLAALTGLRLLLSVYLAQYYDVPRPRALLGHQHFQTLLKQVNIVFSAAAVGAFRSFRFSSLANVPRDDEAFARLTQEFADATGLRPAHEAPDLPILISRPAPAGPFRLSVRLTPYTLADRRWRTCDVPGTLNATLAAAMVMVSQPQPDQVFVDLTCGSGTLLIERLHAARCQAALGGDLSSQALACAAQNLVAARVSAQLLCWDAGRLPLASGQAHVLVANLPFGHQVGSHASNTHLYPHMIAEATRLAKAGARLVLLTHEIHLLEQTLQAFAQTWEPRHQLRITAGKLHPLLTVWKRRSLL